MSEKGLILNLLYGISDGKHRMFSSFTEGTFRWGTCSPEERWDGNCQTFWPRKSILGECLYVLLEIAFNGHGKTHTRANFASALFLTSVHNLVQLQFPHSDNMVAFVYAGAISGFADKASV